LLWLSENAENWHLYRYCSAEYSQHSELGHTLAVNQTGSAAYLRGCLMQKPQFCKHVLRPAAQAYWRSNGGYPVILIPLNPCTAYNRENPVASLGREDLLAMPTFHATGFDPLRALRT